jgi:hypothetical protein
LKPPGTGQSNVTALAERKPGPAASSTTTATKVPPA